MWYKLAENGAVVIEATLSLSVFMFLIVILLSIVNICTAQAKIGIALNQTAEEMSQYLYFYSLSGLNDIQAKVYADSSETRQQIEGLEDGITDGIKSLQKFGRGGSELSDTISEIKEDGSNVKDIVQEIASTDDKTAWIKSLVKVAGNEGFEIGKGYFAGALSKGLNGLKVVYQFCMQEHIEDLRYITQVQADKLEKYADTAYAKELAERELRECQKYLFCHAKNILWDSTVWYLERLHLEQYRVNPSNPVKKFSFMGIEKRENREILQEYMKYCLGVTHLAMSGIQAEFYRILAFVMWMEKETAMELKLASETEIKKYFQIIELKEASYFNDIVIAIYQLYEYLQTKEIIDRIPFRYEYYLKKEIHCHNNRSVEMEIYERILRELKNFPEIPRLILLHSMLIGLRISEVCTLKGDAYSWQGRDAWIQVYQMKMRTYKRVPIPDVLYKIMKRYLEKYHIGSEDYVFQNKRGGAYQYGSFKWQMKELFNKRQDIFKGYDFKSHDFRHTIATLLYDDEVPLQSIRDYLGHDYEEMTQQYVDFMPKKISAANQKFFKKGENSLASGIKKCKRGK